MIDSLVDSHQQAASRIRQALASGDHHQIAEIAHTLKGVASTLMIDQLERLASEVEAANSGGQTLPVLAEKLALLTQQLITECQQ